MLKHIVGLLTMGLSAVSQGACGSGAAKADASAGVDGRLVPDGNPAIDVAHPGDFITGDAGGTTFRAELIPTAGINGLADGLIWLTAGTTSAVRGWTIYIPNSVGTSACPPGWIMLSDDVGGRTDGAGAGCSVTVTHAAPALGDVVEGTFTAALGSLATATTLVAVTNGAFRVTRIHD